MEFSLNLTAERSVVRESLKGVLWTIFFHRLFGPVVPVTNEFLDVPYPMVAGAADIDSTMDQKIDELIKQDFSLATHRSQPSVGQIVVLFAQKVVAKSKKRTGWFGQVKEEPQAHTLRWESWVININCLPLLYREHQQLAAASSSVNSAEKLLRLSALSFEATVGQVMELANLHKDHIPPIMTLDVCPFPYDITIDPQSAPRRPPAADDDTWTHYIKKLMEQV
ncbi:hypothetical protein METBIDRAFT_43432 [Metschnikowia bicuspidata var. bicuspidata NRRL YB-4993]|uniref:Autophagy-related protein 101 n=1 Tax=Metschnikowia bicuspidata var. bicuspidata NRRL YB-4993 TaxID=869754 RepID=A0A1A0H7W0_9ASCO|nr:hypothetical protein METBIDRAFT_43432 [Metschnikowia bicuspidata var. bicuspidata NRRL YB-4993]OBA20184.1 hypothetical protein METBIDRAFT_43432 [Metschnikowia bicuspidata var. bicuspidata NRRL YB-4993]